MIFNRAAHEARMAERLAAEEREQRQQPDATDRALIDAAERLRREPESQPWLAAYPPSGTVATAERVASRTAPPAPLFDPAWPDPPTYTAEQVAELLALLSPGKIECKCGCWTDLGTDPLTRLREHRAKYVEYRQDQLTEEWRRSDAVVAAAESELQAQKERQAEWREAQERATKRQAFADRLFKDLVNSGMSFGEAHAAVTAQFPEF